MPRQALTSAPAALAETTGRALGGIFKVLKIVRPVRPIHPHGMALHGTLIRTGSPAEPSGVEWLDLPGTDTVEARFSRSAGLPQRLPDVLGLALRVTPASGDGFADVLYSTTGWHLPGRFLLMLKREPAGATFTTLMPYQGVNGPVLLGLRTASIPSGAFEKGTLAAGPLAAGDWVLDLYWARLTGPWRPCGKLRLQASADTQDTALRFNPLEHQPPGARTYPWARRLRERSYRVAQELPRKH